jgi:lysophospholipase L1-like esterase
VTITTQELLKSDYLIWHGRKMEDEKGIHFFYTASGFSFKFTGSKIVATFESSFEEFNKRPFIVIDVKSVNHKHTYVMDLKHGKQTIECLDLPHDTYEVDVRKRSESLMSKTILNEISTDGTFLYPTSVNDQLKIEWIGDSSTCGYGNLSTSVDEPFTTESEDGLQTFASIASNILDANYQIVAVSGIGLYKSFYAQVTLPKIYCQIDIHKNIPYDFSFNPDLIVINLGTNDHSYMKFLEHQSLAHEQRTFKDVYKSFINDIFLNHFGAQVLLISQGERHHLVDHAIEQVYLEMSYHKLHHLRVSKVMTEDGIGGQFHPTIKTHQRWGQEVAVKIKQILNYEV